LIIFREYAETYHHPIPLTEMRKRGGKAPGGGIVIISCSDPRVVPQEYLKLHSGGLLFLLSVQLRYGWQEFTEAAIIRNAGGRAVDAVRSLVVLNTLVKIGTVLVIHHTGMK